MGKQKETEETVHKRTATFLQRKQKDLIEQQAQWESKYESECNARDAELAQLTTTRDRSFERLTEVQQRWEKEKEAQRLIELEQLRKEEEERTAQAAAKIQQMYRPHAKAAAEKRAQDEKNKKGKKKKGGKKKKK